MLNSATAGIRPLPLAPRIPGPLNGKSDIGHISESNGTDPKLRIPHEVIIMEDLTYVSKIVGIMAALIIVRLIIRAALKESVVQKLSGAISPILLSPMITGGPMFIAMPVFAYAVKNPEIPSFLVLMPLIGGLGLSWGLVIMLAKLQRQKERIDRLERLIPSEDNEKI